jgi:serine/threonine-protein kinase
VAEAESTAGERQAQIDDLNGQVETLSNQVRKRSELLAHAEEDVRVLQEQVERQGEAPEPGPEMDELRNRLEEAEQERTRLSAELDAARRQVEQLQQQPAAAAAPATPTPATLPQDYPEADVDDYGLPPEDEDGERPRIEGFALQGMIGRGPKGRVYHALKQSSQRHVAFKILHHSVAESQAVLVRLLQDLPRLAALGSANILRQICPGKLSGVVPIAMDFCKKGSLLRRLLRGPIPEPEALAIALQVTSAVRVASAAGLLHLNIKPTNILFAEDDHPLLADFALTPGPDDGTLNLRTGGAWCYSAPELTDPTATPDVRADIYSIGALLYHMLSGDPPFAGDTGAAARDRQKQPARPVREAHAGISEPAEMVVARCLRRNPDSRPQRPSDLVLELERAIDGRPPVQ